MTETAKLIEEINSLDLNKKEDLYRLKAIHFMRVNNDVERAVELKYYTFSGWQD